MRNIRAWIASLCVLVPILLLTWIIRYGVDVPFWDEWSFAKWLVEEPHTPADFFAQMNESRTVVPKAIFLGVARLYGYHPKFYMCLGWAIVLAIFLLVAFQCYRRSEREQTRDVLCLTGVLATSLVLFSPAAHENWLWGIQWVIFVPLLCILLAYQIQSRIASHAFRCGATVLLNLVAMFSFANGMVVWAVSFPYWKELIHLIFERRAVPFRWKPFLAWSAVYALCAAAAVAVYFTGYLHMPSHPSLGFFREHPWTAIQYFAAWSGGPFSSGYSVAIGMTIGFVVLGVMLAFLLGAAVSLSKREPAQRAILLRSLYPTLLIIAYACLSGLMTTLGRAGFGLEYANSPRYLFHSGTLVVGIVAGLDIFRRNANPAGPVHSAKWIRNFTAAMLLLVLAFSFRSWRFGYRFFEITEIGRKHVLFTVRMLPLVPNGPTVEAACPWLDLNALVNTLRAKGYYAVPSNRDWILDELKRPRRENGGAVELSQAGPPELPWLNHAPARGSVEVGGDSLSHPGHQAADVRDYSRSKTKAGMAITDSDPIRIVMSGWSFIPEVNKPADAVLICRRDEFGRMKPWSMRPLGFKRGDIAKKTGYNALRRSGFFEVMHLERDEPLGGNIELFSVDERNHRLFPLSVILPLRILP